MKTGLYLSDLDVMNGVFQHFPAITRVVLFGSRAKGTSKPGSDVDLAVWTSKENDALAVSSFLNEETNLPYFFDVIDMHTLKHKELRAHIERVGLEIFQRK